MGDKWDSEMCNACIGCGGVLDPDLPVAEGTPQVAAKRRFWVPTA